jgi:hypothetical protein
MGLDGWPGLQFFYFQVNIAGELLHDQQFLAYNGLMCI